MPHFIAEYSPNISDKVDFDTLFKAVINGMVSMDGVFPLGGIRCRAFPASHYRIATGEDIFGYIHMTLKIGAGRDRATKQRVGEKIFAIICEQLQTVFDENLIGISFEIVELDSVLNYKKNNIHTYLKSKG